MSGSSSEAVDRARADPADERVDGQVPAVALTFRAEKRYGSDAGTRRNQSTFQRLAA